MSFIALFPICCPESKRESVGWAEARKQVAWMEFLLCNEFLRSWSGYIPIYRGEHGSKEERISAIKLKAKRYPRALLLIAYQAPPTKTTFGYSNFRVHPTATSGLSGLQPTVCVLFRLVVPRTDAFREKEEVHTRTNPSIFWWEKKTG